MFVNKKLGTFTYKTLESPEKITKYLRSELRKEWLQDQYEHPDQTWTPRWLNAVEENKFELRKVSLADIKPLQELMNWKTNSYNFIVELESRLAEAQETLECERAIAPIVVLKEGMELVDGYMRYHFLLRSGESETYAYISI